MQIPQPTQRQRSQLSLALGSIFLALKWELRDFTSCPQATDASGLCQSTPPPRGGQ